MNLDAAQSMQGASSREALPEGRKFVGVIHVTPTTPTGSALDISKGFKKGTFLMVDDMDSPARLTEVVS